MENTQELIENIGKLKTTELGEMRVERNVGVKANDIIRWCHDRIMAPDVNIERIGKNWYIRIDGCIITVNASSYTIITAHRVKL